MRRAFGDDHPVVQNITPTLEGIMAGTLEVGRSANDLESGKSEPTTGTDAIRAAAIDHLRGGRVAEAIGVLQPLVDALDDSTPLELVSELASLFGQALFLSGRREEGTKHLRNALARLHAGGGSPKAAGHLGELLDQMEQAPSPQTEDRVAAWNERFQTALSRLSSDQAEESGAAFRDLRAIADEATSADAIADEATSADALAPEAAARLAIGKVLLATNQNALATTELQRVLSIAEQLDNRDVASTVRELLRKAGSGEQESGGAG